MSAIISEKCMPKEHRSHMLYNLNGVCNFLSYIISFGAKENPKEMPSRRSRAYHSSSELGNYISLEDMAGRVEDLLSSPHLAKRRAELYHHGFTSFKSICRVVFVNSTGVSDMYCKRLFDYCRATSRDEGDAWTRIADRSLTTSAKR